MQQVPYPLSDLPLSTKVAFPLSKISLALLLCFFYSTFSELASFHSLPSSERSSTTRLWHNHWGHSLQEPSSTLALLPLEEIEDFKCHQIDNSIFILCQYLVHSQEWDWIYIQNSCDFVTLVLRFYYFFELF